MARKLKTLKDSLLEYTVLRMKFIFPREQSSRVWTKSSKFEKIPDFPCGLFDEIICKSRSMGWRIPNKYLLSCIVNRDKLQWRDFSSFTSNLSLNNQQFEFISKMAPSPKKLCLQFDLRKIDIPKLFTSLRRVSHTLEHLQLTFTPCYWNQSKPQDDPFTRPRLRLKTLIFHGDFTQLLVTIDPESLRTLELDCSTLTRKCLKTVGTFVNLERLSLNSALIMDASMEEVTEAVSSLKGLNFLDVNNVASKKPALLTGNSIERLLTNLERLETLVVSGLEATSLEGVTPARRLRLLIRTDRAGSNSEPPVRWAEKVARLDDPSAAPAVCGVAWGSALLLGCCFAFLEMLSPEEGLSLEPDFYRAVESICWSESNLLRVNLVSKAGPRRFSPELALRVACELCSSKETNHTLVRPMAGVFGEFVGSSSDGLYVASEFRKYLLKYFA